MGRDWPAFSCTINWGIIDDAKNWIDLPACLYVNDALMLALDVDHMKMVLAAMIKAIFVVMGKPDVAVRQCPLANSGKNCSRAILSRGSYLRLLYVGIITNIPRPTHQAFEHCIIVSSGCPYDTLWKGNADDVTARHPPFWQASAHKHMLSSSLSSLYEGNTRRLQDNEPTILRDNE